MSYTNFNTFKLFENVGINSSGDYMISMKPNDNNVSFHSSNSIDYNNVDIMSIKNIINKKQNEDLNLSSLTGTTINPVITINNNLGDCRIKTNLNVSGNLNINNNLNTEGIVSIGTNISHFSSKVTIKQGTNFGTDLNIKKRGQPVGALTIAKKHTDNENGLSNTSDGGGNNNCMLSLISDFGTLNDATHAGGSIQFSTQSHNGSNAGHGQPYAGIYGGRTNSHTDYNGELIFYTSDDNVDASTNYDSTTGIGKNLNPVMIITGDKRVGIGVGNTHPFTNLHVATDDFQNYNDGAFYGPHHHDHTDSYSPTAPSTSNTLRGGICAYFASGVWARDYVASSDSRIKTNITDVPDNLALEQLRTIPCRYYEYIDKVERGTDQTIGFIAQEVKSVLPMAVSQQKIIIPDVYKIINCVWTSVDDKFNMSSSDLPNVSGIVYRFYVSNNSDYSDEKKIELTGNSDNTFTFDAQYTNVFCYGSEVDDFHTLDKNKLFTLNFSATQEIDRIQQTHITEIASLKTENQEQQTKINTLETENIELKSIIDKLKTANSFEEFKNSL